MSAQLGQIVALLAAAGLGATFSALFEVSRRVGAMTYEPRDDHTYLNRIVLGIATGFILAELLPIESIAGADTLTKPLLALLGGFSAPAVHTVLTQLVSAVESAFKGSPQERVEVEVRSAVSAIESSVRMRLAQVGQMVAEIEGAVEAGAPPEDIKERLRKVRRWLDDE